MSEEEKEAIEEVKRIIEEIEEIYHYDCDREDEKYLKIVLNYINEYKKRITFLREEIYGLNKKTKRLQKENEELKTKYRKNGRVLFTIEAINERYVSKEKIRNKIKELEKTTAEELRYDFLMNRDEVKRAVVKVLEELLGE